MHWILYCFLFCVHHSHPLIMKEPWSHHTSWQLCYLWFPLCSLWMSVWLPFGSETWDHLYLGLGVLFLRCPLSCALPFLSVLFVFQRPHPYRVHVLGSSVSLQIISHSPRYSSVFPSVPFAACHHISQPCLHISNKHRYALFRGVLLGLTGCVHMFFMSWQVCFKTSNFNFKRIQVSLLVPPWPLMVWLTDLELQAAKNLRRIKLVMWFAWYISYFSCCCDETPLQKQLKKGRVCFGSWRGTVYHCGKGIVQEFEGTAYMASVVRSW